MFKGVCTALITPFKADFSVDFEAFGRLIEYQIEGGVSGLLICGTTGEPSTMTADEKLEVIKFGISKINGRVHTMVGTGSNCTADAIKSSIQAESLGADSILVVTPYYNKCTQAGLVEHYRAICNSVQIPVVSYNVPGRTGVNILPSTALALSEIPNLVAIKEACGNVGQILDTAALIKDKMVLYSGDDLLCLPLLALGAQGLISVASNVAPKLVVELVDSYFSGNIDKCRAIQFKLNNFFNALFCEVNPIPAKYACSLLGICEAFVRLPLTEITYQNAEKLKSIMRELGLI